MLKDANWEALAAGIKVSRFEVTKILAEAAIASRKSGDMAKLYGKLSKTD